MVVVVIQPIQMAGPDCDSHAGASNLILWTNEWTGLRIPYYKALLQMK